MNNVRNKKNHVNHVDYIKAHPDSIVCNENPPGYYKETVSMETTNERTCLKYNDKSSKEKSDRKYLYAIG